LPWRGRALATLKGHCPALAEHSRVGFADASTPLPEAYAMALFHASAGASDHERAWRILALAAMLAFALVACSGGPSETPIALATATPPASAATVGAALAAHDVAYQAGDPVLQPGTLDVYAPTVTGPWPVVVMFHGTPSAVDKASLAEHAQRVAGLGFVVFDANWGHLPSLTADPDAMVYANAANAQAACALAFATHNAQQYGGSPDRMIVFGYSGGSNVASVAIFNSVVPTTGCLGGQDPARVDSLVTWEGDFLAAPEFDAVLRAEPGLFDLMTPWSALPRLPDLPVTMLVSEHPGADVEAPMPSDTVAGFLALRDWDGTLARLVASVHAFDDGIISVADAQAVLFEGLRENGNPVTLDIAPGSSHMYLSPGGWLVFLAAFGKALAAIG